ncbi:MAG: sulfotransferase family protein [Rhodanobacteraceae bacterium]
MPGTDRYEGDDRVNVSVCFVCDTGRLEAQAVVLAASLREWLPDLELIAAVPRMPADATCRVLADLGVGLEPIVNPVADDYPIGHKVAALGVGRPGDLRVFLDTDTLCLRPPDWQVVTTHRFAAKPADIATFGDTQTWQRLYRRFGLEMPPRMMVASVSEVLMPPYFNAGMIATTEAAALASEWARICRAIDAMEDINPRRPWLDQIALPIAVARLGLAFRSLDEAWNYPAHMKPLSVDAAIVHYHQPAVIAREPRLAAQVGRLMVRYPQMTALLEADPAWAPVMAVLDRQRMHSRGRWPWQRPRSRMADGRVHRNPRNDRDLIISGIPRSGTSYLCKLLEGFDNVAVINEPRIVFDWLRYSPDPWTVPILHADLRRCIDTGEPVENKLDTRGELTEDTAVEESVRDYRPRLRDANWVLATKNTLAYMARLEGILRLMPEARVVLCVRHPLDTLASWKGTFAHLAAGDPSNVPVGGLADPFLSAQLRDGLQVIASLPEAAYRRAAWWRLLAQEVVRWRERVVIVRYEDLVADPARESQRALGPLARAAGRPRIELKPSPARTSRRRKLDDADYDAVATQCADVASLLGYDDVSAAEVSG